VEHLPYHDLSRPEDGQASTAYFVLDSLLKSRIECGFESDAAMHDESVNIYLVHLLSSLVSQPGLGELTAPRDVDVFEKVRHSVDPRYKSAVYRANADQLLVSTGIFGGSVYVERDGQRHFDGATHERIGRGKAYYHYAASFQGRVGPPSRTVSDVLWRLSNDFERFVDLLFHMRGAYFHLYRHLRESDFRELESEASRPPPGEVPLERLHDEFLDAYWAWHQQPDSAAREALQLALTRLRSADADFDFRLPDL
jgi:hypothetical protein